MSWTLWFQIIGLIWALAIAIAVVMATFRQDRTTSSG